MTLEERLAEWPMQWLQQGREQGSHWQSPAMVR